MIKQVRREGAVEMTFDVQVAKVVGVEEAILFNHISWWCSKNRENGTEHHLHEGTYWTYLTKRELSEHFGFWSAAQIKRMLSKLLKNEYIRKGSFNRKGYDKTLWYTPTYETSAWIGMSISTEEINQPAAIKAFT